MPDAIALQDAPTDQPRTWLEANVTLITRIAIQAARRHRLPPQDRQELLSIFWTHLAKDDYRVLRQFRGSSGIATYLRTVIDRVVLDMRTSSWGKWRPSARARRLGAPAEAFERLVIRDGRAPEEAHALLRAMMGPAVPADLVDSLAGQRPAPAPPRRPRPRVGPSRDDRGPVRGAARPAPRAARASAGPPPAPDRGRAAGRRSAAHPDAARAGSEGEPDRGHARSRPEAPLSAVRDHPRTPSQCAGGRRHFRARRGGGHLRRGEPCASRAPDGAAGVLRKGNVLRSSAAG